MASSIAGLPSLHKLSASHLHTTSVGVGPYPPFEQRPWKLIFEERIEAHPKAKQHVIMITLMDGVTYDSRQRKMMSELTSLIMPLFPSRDGWVVDIGGKWHTTCTDHSLSKGVWKMHIDLPFETEEIVNGPPSATGIPGGSTRGFLARVFGTLGAQALGTVSDDEMSTVILGNKKYTWFQDDTDDKRERIRVTWQLAEPAYIEANDTGLVMRLAEQARRLMNQLPSFREAAGEGLPPIRLG